LIKKIGVRLGLPLTRFEPFIAISGPSLVAFRLPPGYNGEAEVCRTPEARGKIEKALSALLNRAVTVGFEQAVDGSSGPAPLIDRPAPAPAPRKREEVLESDPLIRKMVDLFEARLLHSEYDDDPPRSPAR